MTVSWAVVTQVAGLAVIHPFWSARSPVFPATIGGVTVVPLPLPGMPPPPGSASPTGVPGESWQADQFRERSGLRIHDNHTVHAITWVADSRGIEIPVPACHVGAFGAWEWWRVYTPTHDPVTCRLPGCRTTRDELAAGQLRLF
nr:hypothetical protein GCM10020241_03510 [Streptoalloteichus tenebrarius]